MKNHSNHLPFTPVLNRQVDTEKYDQYFFGHGKILLSGEYFILDGADGLALPTSVGQSMGVRYSHSFNPQLIWRSYDFQGNLWLKAHFEFWHFECLDKDPAPEVLLLQKILRLVRNQNKHFLRDEGNVLVETHLGFPLEWGLGSSSTLIYNIAQWAHISPFKLAFDTLGGSGYDIACAQSHGPILYQRKSLTPRWSAVSFNPSFKENLYFIHLGKKGNTQEAINHYNQKRPFSEELIEAVSLLTQKVLAARKLTDFNQWLWEHEKLVARHLHLTPLKIHFFSDYWGEIKSLGAWGGDLILATSDRSPAETCQYFASQGFKTIVPFEDLILKTSPSLLHSSKDRSLVH